MIITCEQCSTQFQLDDAKVPETGIRVRCSRCKCAFFVESPHAPAADLTAGLGIETPASEPSNGQSGAEAESDWKFNDDIDPVLGPNGPIDELSAARDAVDDLLGGDLNDPVTGVADGNALSDIDFELAAEEFAADATGATDSPTHDAGALDDSEDPNAITIDHGTQAGELDTEIDPESTGDRTVTAGSAPEPEDSSVIEESDFGTGTDLDLAGSGDPESDWSTDSDWSSESDWSDESVAPPEPDLDIGSPVAEPTASSQAAEPDAEAPLEAAPEASPATDSGGDVDASGDDLGNPENWDFFDGGDAKPAGADFEPFEGEASGDDAASPFIMPIEIETDVPPEAAWVAHARGTIGWSLVAGMCLYVISVSFAPNLLTTTRDESAVRIAGLETARVEGRWIDNAVAGSIYVVSGDFHQSGGERAESGTALRVRLLDSAGKAVAAESAAVGPPIPVVSLRESDPEDLRVAQERGAPGILHDRLARRKRRSFAAVLSTVPPEAVAFDFQLASAAATAANQDDAPSETFDANAQAALAREGQAESPPSELAPAEPANSDPVQISETEIPVELPRAGPALSAPTDAAAKASPAAPRADASVRNAVPAAPAPGGQ